MVSEEIQQRLDEAAKLAIVRSDVDLDQAILAFEQAKERLENAQGDEA